MRRRAGEVLHRLLGEIAFDPAAPEAKRAQQVAALRARVAPRAAG
jgi:hypothetical protein